MNEIRVLLRPPTDRGRLYPRYVAEAHTLAVESRVARQWPYGINVDAMLICDLDEDRVLANLDLHYDRRLWPRDARVRWPELAPASDLVFEEATARQKNFGSRVDVTTDSTRRIVDIRVDSHEVNGMAALSDDCVVLLHDSNLAGFVVRVA
jgi:hypothetical protein